MRRRKTTIERLSTYEKIFSSFCLHKNPFTTVMHGTQPCFFRNTHSLDIGPDGWYKVEQVNMTVDDMKAVGKKKFPAVRLFHGLHLWLIWSSESRAAAVDVGPLKVEPQQQKRKEARWDRLQFYNSLNVCGVRYECTDMKKLLVSPCRFAQKHDVHFTSRSC